MFCSVFAGEGEGWEAMVLFTDCPVVKLIDRKKKPTKKTKNTFGIKKISKLSCNNVGLCFVSGRFTFFFYVSFHRKSTC